MTQLIVNATSKTKTRLPLPAGFVFVRGIGLVEVLLSVTIISVILVMATRYFYTALNTQRVNHTVSEVASLVSALQAWDRGNSDFSGLGSEGILNLYNAGFISKTNDLVTTADGNGTVNAATLYNAWSLPITVSGQVGSATISTSFAKATQCSAVASNFAGATCSETYQFSYVLSE